MSICYLQHNKTLLSENEYVATLEYADVFRTEITQEYIILLLNCVELDTRS